MATFIMFVEYFAGYASVIDKHTTVAPKFHFLTVDGYGLTLVIHPLDNLKLSALRSVRVGDELVFGHT